MKELNSDLVTPYSHHHCVSKIYLVVEGTHVQGGVSRCILGAHISSVEQQVFQVLHVTIAASLKRQIHTFNPFKTCKTIVAYEF